MSSENISNYSVDLGLRVSDYSTLKGKHPVWHTEHDFVNASDADRSRVFYPPTEQIRDCLFLKTSADKLVIRFKKLPEDSMEIVAGDMLTQTYFDNKEKVINKKDEANVLSRIWQIMRG